MSRKPRLVGEGTEHGAICLDCRNSGMRDVRQPNGETRLRPCECLTPVVGGVPDDRRAVAGNRDGEVDRG
jgi:hypothetical protein